MPGNPGQRTVSQNLPGQEFQVGKEYINGETK